MKIIKADTIFLKTDIKNDRAMAEKNNKEVKSMTQKIQTSEKLIQDLLDTKEQQIDTHQWE